MTRPQLSMAQLDWPPLATRVAPETPVATCAGGQLSATTLLAARVVPEALHMPAEHDSKGNHPVAQLSARCEVMVSSQCPGVNSG